jgi:diguanylate cyclase (GGDEF)-like protein
MSETALNSAWESALEALHFAFQPIVRSSGGRAYGYEALLRGWKEAGFYDIASVFDSAYLDGVLAEFDGALRERAIRDFAAWAPSGTKLFYNIDNRTFLSSSAALDDTVAAAQSLGLSPSRIVLEISERHELEGDALFDRVLALCRERSLRIAIDDFGTGYAGLKLLRMSEPDIVKIDRHFVAGTGSEPRKAAFLEKIVGMAHLMGVSVVAEGIETDAELCVCLESGCDMMQGFLLGKPVIGEAAFVSSFPAMGGKGGESRRGRSRLPGISSSSVRVVTPALVSEGFIGVLDRFRKEIDLDILPVVDSSGEPVGIYLERDFRPYVYSPYGIALLEHMEAGKGASSFLRKAPVAAITADLGRLLEVFGAQPGCGGVILTNDSAYAGLLPAAELLSRVAERELAEARDQNPLTRLPGNLRVAEIIAERMADLPRSRAFVYFDFDDFKPFNDRYGFRLGDRVIQLFADILRSTFARSGCFIGHLGGDDFFAFTYALSIEAAMGTVREASERFRREAVSFYTAEDRDRGWILGKDRSGAERRMNLIGVSAAVVFVPEGAFIDSEPLSELLASLKREAKLSELHNAYKIVDRSSLGASGALGARVGQGPAFAVFAPALLASM